ncbi:MAG: type II toxin-antitoxin system VapC family toxin [Anaerolineae bacterium]
MHAVTDTHALLWYLLADARLSTRAKRVFDDAAASGDTIGVPSICLVEIVYLVDKGRVPSAALDTLITQLETRTSVLEMIPLDQAVALSVQRVERTQVPDMPDRIIAATALHLELPIISRDYKIRLADLEAIW